VSDEILMLSPVRAFYHFAEHWDTFGAPHPMWIASMILFALVGAGLAGGALAGFARYRMRDV
jgi:hypothetical protein